MGRRNDGGNYMMKELFGSMPSVWAILRSSFSLSECNFLLDVIGRWEEEEDPDVWSKNIKDN